MKTRVTELLGIEYPIIQGGMAWVAESHLAERFRQQEDLELSVLPQHRLKLSKTGLKKLRIQQTNHLVLILCL